MNVQRYNFFFDCVNVWEFKIIKYHLDILFIYPNWHPYRHSFHPLSPKRWAYIIKTQKKKSFAIAFKTSAKLFGARNRT